MRDRAARAEIQEGMNELETPRNSEAGFIVQSTQNLRAAEKQLQALTASAQDTFAGVVIDETVFPADPHDAVIDAIRLASGDSCKAVLGNELRVVADNYHEGRLETVYLGSVRLASSYRYYQFEQTDCQVFGNAVTISDYQAFLNIARELAGNEVTLDAGREVPQKLLEEARTKNASIVSEGLEDVSALLDQAKGAVVGTQRHDRHQGGYHSSTILHIDNPQDEKQRTRLLESLSKGASVVLDFTLVHSRKSSGVSSSESYAIGSKVVASYYHHEEGGETSYQVMGQEVPREQYDCFVAQIREVVSERYPSTSTELPAELQAELSKLDMRNTLLAAFDAPAGRIKLKHIYRNSGLDSGPLSGSVTAYDLSAWRNGEKVTVDIQTERGDNGFVSGLTAVSIKPGMLVVCRGGDSISDRVRSWSEIYKCEAQG